mgnify:FL=1
MSSARVTRRLAILLGALAALLVGGAWMTVRMSRQRPCPGALFVEFHPPLARPGVYEFALEWQDEAPRRCELRVPLPPSGPVDTGGCNAKTELLLEGTETEPRIARLALGAAPAEVRLRVTRRKESIYDAVLSPAYADYPTTREESFCGPRALVEPDCRRGTADCAPYPLACDGPEDCGRGEICCVSRDWARESGARTGAHCMTTRRCLDRFASVACHDDTNCPEPMRCTDRSQAADFAAPVALCRRPGGD